MKKGYEQLLKASANMARCMLRILLLSSRQHKCHPKYRMSMLGAVTFPK